MSGGGLDSSAIVALASLTVTVLGALLAGIWKLAGLTKQIEMAVANLQEQIDEFRGDRARLDQVPLLAQRIGQLEKVVATEVRTRPRGRR